MGRIELYTSQSPHIHRSLTYHMIMWYVVIALMPAMFASFYVFGIKAVILILTAVVSCVVIETLIKRMFFNDRSFDASPVITGILLAFNIPSSLPLWQLVMGCFFSIAVVKMTFGGLGKNPFNPAIAGRIFLLISFPVDMTTWPKPLINRLSLADAVTGPTILGNVREGLMNGHSLKDITASFPSYIDLLIGKMGGSLGEVSTLALLAGGIFLFSKRIISWHIPFTFISSLFIFTGIFWFINPDLYINPLYHVLSGGLVLGALFMATDYSSSPMTGKGMLVFGTGCGIITAIIRLWGSYPEGVSFAILMMNATVPLIDKIFKPDKFGH